MKPAYKFSEVLERTNTHSGAKRICISMITNPRAADDVVRMTRQANEALDVPISVLVTPTVLKKEHLESLRSAGADAIGLR